MNYKVIPLALSGKGKRMFKDGDIVTENDFPSGAIPSLIKGGYLAPMEVKEVKAEVNKPKVEVKPQETKTVAKAKPTAKKSTSTKKR